MYTFKASRWSSHSALLRALPDRGEGRAILDVGCGPGYLGELFSQRGYRVTGIEHEGLSGPAFPPSVRLIEADLDQGLPPLFDRFDFVICADVLEHLRRPADLLRQTLRVLAPGGVLVASLPNSGNIWFRLNVMMGRFPQEDKGLFDRTHLRFYTWQGWLELFAQAGYRVELREPTAIPVGLVLPETWAESAVVHAAESVFYGLARVRKQLFAYQFVICARPV